MKNPLRFLSTAGKFQWNLRSLYNKGSPLANEAEAGGGSDASLTANWSYILIAFFVTFSPGCPLVCLAVPFMIRVGSKNILSFTDQ